MLPPVAAAVTFGLSLAFSVAAYFWNRFIAERRAEAASQLVSSYKMLLVTKYLERRRDPLDSRDIEFIVNNIIAIPFDRLVRVEPDPTEQRA